MTKKQLKELEAELEVRGYKKWTRCLTSSESWSWFKTFDKECDGNGEVVSGYQVAFRVWGHAQFGQNDQYAYGFDFWTSPIGTDSRMDFTSNWEPIRDFATFEAMAADFNARVRKYVKH